MKYIKLILLGVILGYSIHTQAPLFLLAMLPIALDLFLTSVIQADVDALRYREEQETRLAEWNKQWWAITTSVTSKLTMATSIAYFIVIQFN